MENYSTVTFTAFKKCNHNTGWYGSVPFFFDCYRKPIYCCSKCGEILYDKELRDFRKKVKKNISYD